MDTKKLALIIGNSDGIGLGLTRRLLDLGWWVQGLSRSSSPLEHQCYDHEIADVASDEFPELLAKAAAAKPNLCVYCPGIGEALDLDRLEQERVVFEVNLMGAVKMFAAVLPMMIGRGSGQILVLSSLADGMLSPEAPSYSAS
ncbi:MAG: SDR family NAD(P)-dependent oxidoreductase, partial [Candidatus Zixiibacteriota bacterium]